MTPQEIAALRVSHTQLVEALTAILSAKYPLERANAIQTAREALANAVQVN